MSPQRYGFQYQCNSLPQKAKDISKDVYKEKKYQITRELDAIHIEKQKIPKLPKEWKKIYSDLTAENKRLFWKKIIEKVVITRETKETPLIFFRG